MEKIKRHKTLRRFLFFAVLPLSLVAKAVYSVLKAMRQREDKLLEADRKLVRDHLALRFAGK